MKKKGTLVKRLLIYAFSLCMLSLYTTSCLSYDEDVDDIYNRLKELQSQIDAINQKIEGKHFITSVESIPGGMKVTFDDGRAYSIVNGIDGAKGDKGTTWDIGVDSMWYKDGELTRPPIRAIPVNGKPGETAPSPEIFKKNENEYYWILFKWDTNTNDFVRDTLDDRQGYEPLYSYNTYVVDRGAYYELYVWVQDLETPDNSQYKKIDLPKYIGDSAPFLEFLGYEHFNVKHPERPISLGGILPEMRFWYWYIPRIKNIVDNDNNASWLGPKTIEPGQVLTTLERDSAVAIIRTNLSKGSWNLTLKDSQGKRLPINFGSPVAHTGSFTKALGYDSIYILQMHGIQEPLFTDAADYRSRFQAKDGTGGLVYSLIDTVTGTNSGYKTSIEIIPGGDAQTALYTIGGDVGIDNGTDSEKEYAVKQDTILGIRFTNSAYLYDYYIEAVDSMQAADKFTFTVDKPNGTFSVIKTDPADPLEKFKAIVYRLHYSGEFYKDTVLIKPIPIVE
ncbi:MAG: DUF4988 domain-containing protein [Tannerellaceae bacterium]|jgi:hypothetical protein|nr:DUF4988 domain-containing protein [Tannerellaceae bacterium]